MYLFPLSLTNIIPQHILHREILWKTTHKFTNEWSHTLHTLTSFDFQTDFFSLLQANVQCFETLYPFEIRDALCSAFYRKLIFMNYVFLLKKKTLKIHV